MPRSTYAHAANRRGDEPATARSPLRLRLGLAAGAGPIFTFAAWAAFAAARSGAEPRAGLLTVGVMCALVAMTAFVDIVVLIRKLRRGEGRRGSAPRIPGPRRQAGATDADSVGPGSL